MGSSTSIYTSGYWLLAPALALLLGACGGARHAAHPHAEELSDFVLIIRGEPNGQVGHSWLHSTEVDLPRYAHSPRAGSRARGIVLASRRPRDCDQEQLDCVQACMKRRLPSYLNHIKRGDGSKARFCEKECLDEYMECLELQKAHALRFTAVDGAVEWLKRNREELLLGTVVVIAGVAFVTISAGAGAVVLAPAVLVAT
ncbi:hypothetical protein F0U61_40060 [Archangium violaceum]|uniref:hypothetical protein n=1 Tax=Archangium violaceum TaxID=83451 RepID=UPI002B2EBA20|nr:hypothetical protein F0U61_40060 [Archangium violaceum]